MITAERLEELIKQGATIYQIGYNGFWEIPLINNKENHFNIYHNRLHISLLMHSHLNPVSHPLVPSQQFPQYLFQAIRFHHWLRLPKFPAKFFLHWFTLILNCLTTMAGCTVCRTLWAKESMCCWIYGQAGVWVAAWRLRT